MDEKMKAEAERLGMTESQTQRLHSERQDLLAELERENSPSIGELTAERNQHLRPTAIQRGGQMLQAPTPTEPQHGISIVFDRFYRQWHVKCHECGARSEDEIHVEVPEDLIVGNRQQVEHQMFVRSLHQHLAQLRHLPNCPIGIQHQQMLDEFLERHPYLKTAASGGGMVN